MRGFATLEEANFLTTSDAPDSWGAGVVVLFLEDEEREAVEREADVVRAGFLEELLFELLEEDLPVPVLPFTVHSFQIVSVLRGFHLLRRARMVAASVSYCITEHPFCQ